MKRFPLLIASILLPYFIVAQAFLGLTEGKYNGTTSIFSNPALGLSSKYSWDATIGGGHVFLETNYARLPNSNLFDVYSNYEEIDIIEIDTPLIAYQKPLLFNRIIGKGKVDGHFQIMGPSLNIKIRDDISLGFSIRMRGMFSSYDIPSGLGFYPIQNLPESEVISYSEFDLSTAIWAEYNLHLAKKFDNKQTIGASVRVYSPYGGSYIALHDPFSFVLENGELTTESNFDFKGGLSEISTERKGLGLGIDLGYLKVLNETSRLGISILDIGMMNFSGFTYEAIAGKGDVFLQSDYISKSIDSIFIQLNQDFGHTLGKEGNFALGAPTAISFQYTTNVHKDISVNFNWIQRLKLAKAQLLLYFLFE